MMFFGCFFQQDVFSMHIFQACIDEMTPMRHPKVSHDPEQTEKFISKKSQQNSSKAPVTQFSTLEIGLGKMLNFESWLELQYSILAVINPGMGKSDQRIQKYVDKWALSLQDARNITEKVVGECIKTLCKSQNIDLDTPDSTGFLPITLAVYTGEEAVVRVLMAAGVALAQNDGHGYTPLALSERFRRMSIFEELSKKIA